MSLRTSPWPVGTPCWADLSVPDVDAARRFYGAVLGWQTDEPDEQYGGYVLAQVRGASAAGIGPQQTPDLPAAWTLYLASDDVDATVAAATEAGGAVLAAPFDVGPVGRMAVVADPSGAAFGVWQAGQHIGAGIVNEPGALTWEDLRSTDPAAAQAFYRAVFDFRVDRLEMAGPDYGTFAHQGDEAPLGGMGPMMGAPEGTPSHWLVYFGVEDVPAAAHAAEAAGGTVLAPPFDTPFGQMAGLADPAGAVFWVAQSGATQQPDRSG